MTRWTRSALLMVALAFAAPVAAQVAPDTAKPVKLMTIEASGKGMTRQFFGQVVARQTVDLAFQVAGQVVEFPVLEGEAVPKGALIAQLDMLTFDLARDQARLQQEQADRVVDRLSRLSDASASEVRREDATTEAGLARIAVARAEFAHEHTSLYAPFDALVAAREVANFTTVAAGTPIVRLHDMSELRIEIDVPEILFQRVGRDPDVELMATFPVTDQSYPVEVREFNAETSSIGQTFRLTFGMAPPEGLRVLPGSSVTISARINSDETQMTVPPTAIAKAPDGATSVLKFEQTSGDSGTLHRIPVAVTANANGVFSITGNVAPGDEIVVAGVGLLEDGADVRRFSGFAN